MKKLKFLLSRFVGLASRTVMRTGSIMLRRRGRLEALSAAIEWFVKRNNHQPLEITHESDYGDVHLMSDGNRIQLTWWIGDRDQPENTGSVEPGDGGKVAPVRASSTTSASTTKSSTSSEAARTNRSHFNQTVGR